MSIFLGRIIINFERKLIVFKYITIMIIVQHDPAVYLIQHYAARVYRIQMKNTTAKLHHTHRHVCNQL